MDKNQKILFFTFTIPATIFMGLILGIFYFMLTVYGLLIIIALSIGIARKKQLFIRYNRILVILLFVLILLYPNLTLWPQQFVRRLPGGRQSLIDSNHPFLPTLNNSFQDWHRNYYGVNFSDVDNFENEVYHVDRYIRRVRMEYKYDLFQPYMMEDHLPTISEIINSDFDGDGKWEDDCDGITFLTTSFLLFLGYNAYVSEIEFHYHTIVYKDGIYPNTKEGYEQGILLYTSEPKHSFYIFNETDLFIPPSRSIFLAFIDIIKDDYIGRHLGYLVVEDSYTDFESNPILQIGIWVVIIPIIGFLLAIIFSLLLSMFNWNWIENRKEKIYIWVKSAFIFSIIIGILILYYYLADSYSFFNNNNFNIEWLSNITLFIGIGFFMRFIDRNMFLNRKNLSTPIQD